MITAPEPWLICGLLDLPRDFAKHRIFGSKSNAPFNLYFECRRAARLIVSFDDDIVERIALVRTLKLDLMNPAAR